VLHARFAPLPRPRWVFGRGLYINELMAKKFSLLGCVGILITVLVQVRAHDL
jgi:hypothetical protein